MPDIMHIKSTEVQSSTILPQIDQHMKHKVTPETHISVAICMGVYFIIWWLVVDRFTSFQKKITCPVLVLTGKHAGSDTTMSLFFAINIQLLMTGQDNQCVFRGYLLGCHIWIYFITVYLLSVWLVATHRNHNKRELFFTLNGAKLYLRKSI